MILRFLPDQTKPEVNNQALLHRAYLTVNQCLAMMRPEERLPMLRALQTQVEISLQHENGIT
jgi:hypothetical protein